MSTVDVVMPQMGVSVSEGTVSRWMKAVGETIEKDETLLEISTDKVDTEVPSPASGVVTEILAQEGDTLDVGARLAVIATEAGAAAPAAAPEPAPAQAVVAPPAPAPVAAPVAAPVPAAPVAMPAAPAAGNGNGTAAPGRFVSPVVARIVAEHGVDVNAVPGTGSGGRVTKKDIMSFLASGGTAAPAATTPAPAVAGMPVAPAAVPASAVATPATLPATPAPTFTGGEQVINFNPMRKAIARHMTDSLATSAHVTSTIEVDMTNVVRMRGQVKGELLTQWGVKVTFTHFVIRALIDAVAHYPMINSEIRGDSAVMKHYLNLGVAVALDGGEGLIVPVVKNAEEKNLVGIARAVNDLADRARSKRLGPDDVVGGTFTLTNPGVFGTIHGTPIINQPQVAILDTEAIVKRPWVLTDAQGNDSIAIRSIMNMAMSYDHRLIDGAYAAQFLAHLRRNLETWDYARFMG